MMFMHFALLMEMAEIANCSLVFLFPFLHGDITFIGHVSTQVIIALSDSLAARCSHITN